MTRKTKELNSRSVIKAFGLFILFYGLLMIPWPGLGTTYSGCYRAGATLLFESFGSQGAVRFERSNHPEYDLKITLYNLNKPAPDGGGQPFKAFCLTSRYSAYIYAAFVAALILATPISWKRRGWAMLWGMILIHGCLAFKIFIMLLYHFVHTPNSPMVFDPVLKQVIFFAQEAFLRHVAFSLMVSAFIWFLVSFRREDRWG